MLLRHLDVLMLTGCFAADGEKAVAAIKDAQPVILADAPLNRVKKALMGF